MLTLRLNSWLKKIVREGKHFERLTVDAQHELRKRVKSLRYALEFCVALLPGKRPEHLRASLEVVQEALGQLNDLYVAHAAYKKLVQHQPQAWFALGWLAAMQEVKKAQAALCFSVLAEAAAHEDTDKPV
jgi:CHAD domain-containing protein